jgi:acetyl esterase/lipase
LAKLPRQQSDRLTCADGKISFMGLPPSIPTSKSPTMLKSALPLIAIALALSLGVPLLAAEEIQVEKNLVYATKDKKDLKLDAYLPTGNGPKPSVVVIHGGGWMSGSKWQLGRYAAALAKRGVNTFAINYRLAPKYKHPAQVEDCRDAVRWVRKNSKKYGGDPKRIGALGYSAGAHLSAMLAVTGMDAKEDPEGIGTEILVAVGGGTPCEFFSLPPDNKAMAYWLGGSRKRFPKVYQDASPISHLDAEDSPIFFFHGAVDGLVRVSGAREMSKKMQELGIDTKFYLIEDAGHFAAVFNLKAFEAGFDFLGKHLQMKQGPSQKRKKQ